MEGREENAVTKRCEEPSYECDEAGSKLSSSTILGCVETAVTNQCVEPSFECNEAGNQDKEPGWLVTSPVHLLTPVIGYVNLQDVAALRVTSIGMSERVRRAFTSVTRVVLRPGDWLSFVKILKETRLPKLTSLALDYSVPGSESFLEEYWPFEKCIEKCKEDIARLLEKCPNLVELKIPVPTFAIVPLFGQSFPNITSLRHFVDLDCDAPLSFEFRGKMCKVFPNVAEFALQNEWERNACTGYSTSLQNWTQLKALDMHVLENFDPEPPCIDMLRSLS
eukprot:39423_1